MSFLFIGHSHMNAAARIYDKAVHQKSEFLQLHNSTLSEEEIERRIKEDRDETIVTMILGNAHNTYGLVRHRQPFRFYPPHSPRPVGTGEQIRPLPLIQAEIGGIAKRELDCIRWIAGLSDKKVLLVIPPPPKPSEVVLRNPQNFAERFEKFGIAPDDFRAGCWQVHRSMLIELSGELGLMLVDVPPETVGPDGLLKAEYCREDATHANFEFGKLLLERIAAVAAGEEVPGQTQENPYRPLPPANWWSSAVARTPPEQVHPMNEAPFLISPEEKVVTAGSCFAQHIARNLAAKGFNYHVTENGEGDNYGVFSARYGNIYTTRQWVQLIDRAFGNFEPVDQVWEENGRFYDPYRPDIEPGGFPTKQALNRDRAKHLAAVRRALKEADIFVFTLGLTECWMNCADGAVYPVVPGGIAGRFDDLQHRFKNLGVTDVVADLEQAISKIRETNKNVRFLFTVSPVPLKATAEPQHVLAATTYSKSVLRAAVGEVCQRQDGCAYFPSYEIITGSYSRGAYFAENQRGVRNEGVEHVMRVFFQSFASDSREAAALATSPSEDDIREQAEINRVICEEEALEDLRKQ